MSKTLNNQLSNCVVYIDGNCMLGRAEDIKLPVIKFKQDDKSSLGMVGTFKQVMGLESMEGDIKWNSFYADVWQKILNPYQAVQLQIRGSLETWVGGSRTDEQPYVVLLSVNFSEVPGGDFKPRAAAEFPSKFSASYMKQIVAGQEVLEYDAMNNIYKVGGVDMLEQYRLNLGL